MDFFIYYFLFVQCLFCYAPVKAKAKDNSSNHRSSDLRKKVFLKISQNSRECTCVEVPFLVVFLINIFKYFENPFIMVDQADSLSPSYLQLNKNQQFPIT